MDKGFTRNAIIKSARLSTEDYGVLTAWLDLDYGGGGQGFGGYNLYNPGAGNRVSRNYAGHFIYRCLEIAGVDRWDQLPGKTIRVNLDQDGLGGLIQGIGHIVEDKWFFPKRELA